MQILKKFCENLKVIFNNFEDILCKLRNKTEKILKQYFKKLF